jgi:hypothetical protein
MDSICTKIFRDTAEALFRFSSRLYGAGWDVALPPGHDLAGPDMLILYHTFMVLGRAGLAWEDRLRPLVGADLLTSISYSDLSVHSILLHQTSYRSGR